MIARRSRQLFLVALVLVLVKIAFAQEAPPAPAPPLEMWELTQHYVVWEAICPSENGPQECWVYVVKRRSRTDCSMADVDGDGYVGVGDLSAIADQWGCYEEPN